MTDHMYIVVRSSYRMLDEALQGAINSNREFSFYFAGFPEPRKNPYAS